MKKTEALTWEEVYNHWHTYTVCRSTTLLEPLSAHEIHVNFRGDAKFYGYDWLSQKEYEERKRVIDTNVTSFLLLTESTNKGTIRTVQMLAEARDDEERAAIWLYAVTREFMETARGSAYRFASQINGVCWTFLSGRFFMWHHAMKRLVPQSYISYDLLVDTDYSSVEAIIDLAILNAELVAHEYVPILYSSLKPGETAPDISVRKLA